MGQAKAIPTASRALKHAALASLFLSLIKMIAYVASGSVVVLASVVDSLGDTLLSLFNKYLHDRAQKSPDREHPFGHGGIEVLGSLFQGLVIAGLGVIVICGAVFSFNSADASPLHQQATVLGATTVLLLSALGGWLIQLYLSRCQQKIPATEERSLALSADRVHYAGDAWVNLAGAFGLLLVWMTGQVWPDRILGAVGGLMLIRSAWPILRQTAQDILHSEVDVELQQLIFDTAMASDGRIMGVHRLRSRQLGTILFVDFHLKLPREMSLEEAHEIGEKATEEIRAKIPRADVSIHLDPDSEPDDDYWSPAYKKD